MKKDQQGLLRYKGRIYVPDKNQLRSRLCIVAHAGAAGHRSIEMTRKILGERFCWKGMADFVTDFCHHCLQYKFMRLMHSSPGPASLSGDMCLEQLDAGSFATIFRGEVRCIVMAIVTLFWRSLLICC